MMSRQHSPILAIIGPTAVGKSSLGLALAERMGAEIVSADSRQVYRELTIGTAKPPPEDLERVRHHFIDELELDQSFSAGVFARQATERIQTILNSGRTPIVVGGSTLYIEALVHGLSEIPATKPETRARLMERLAEEGAGVLFNELTIADPRSAATMDATKSQRIVRALEVLHDTGRPLSYYHRAKTTSPFDFSVVVLDRPRRELYDRINRRVDRMLEAGLIEENRRLLERGTSGRANPLRTIGYKEPRAYLEGQIDYEEMVTSIKQNSRRYAKRQLTWFRRRSSYRWVDATLPAEELVDTLVR